MEDLFSAVSEHTDPFTFYHSPTEHTFADVTDFEDDTESVYFVECHDGAVRVEERTFERTGTEVLIDWLPSTESATRSTMIERAIIQTASYGTDQFASDFTLIIYVGMIAIIIGTIISAIRSMA